MNIAFSQPNVIVSKLYVRKNTYISTAIIPVQSRYYLVI